MHTRHSWIRSLFLGVAAAMLAACAQLPPAIASLDWQDQWGDRGAGVLARDYDMCAELVEQKRSLLSNCMAARGWSSR